MEIEDTSKQFSEIKEFMNFQEKLYVVRIFKKPENTKLFLKNSLFTDKSKALFLAKL